MRAATVSTSRDITAARAATDVLVMPEVSKVEIRDFGAYEPAVAEGYRAMIEALDKLDRPVQALRRRPSLVEQAHTKALGAAGR
jgi:NTE family protein